MNDKWPAPPELSADVDLFAEACGEFDFPEAVGAVISAYQRDGLKVQTEVLAASCCLPERFS